jgi:hypothetical protein
MLPLGTTGSMARLLPAHTDPTRWPDCCPSALPARWPDCFAAAVSAPWPACYPSALPTRCSDDFPARWPNSSIPSTLPARWPECFPVRLDGPTTFPSRYCLNPPTVGHVHYRLAGRTAVSPNYRLHCRLLFEHTFASLAPSKPLAPAHRSISSIGILSHTVFSAFQGRSRKRGKMR